MYHKFLDYMLGTNPQRHISKTGVTVRKFGYCEVGVKPPNLIGVERKANARATVEKNIVRK